MAKWRVPLVSYANATVTVEAPDDADPEEIVEAALMEGVPSICAQCSGWGRDYSIDMGDEWEPVGEDAEAPEVYKVED